MIITVTFNPAIDKTAEVDELIPGKLHRLTNVLSDAGGKGINVSKTLKAIGKNSLATGFTAGTSGQFIKDKLDKLDIAHCFIDVPGQTRTNLKVLNRAMVLTELNEAGPEVTKADIERLTDAVLINTDEDTVVVLSGNVSPGAPDTVYQDMIEKIHAHGGKVLLDADGALFANGLKAGPDVIKPNRYELSQYFGVDEDMDDQMAIRLARKLLNAQTKLCVVSMGADGSLFITEDKVYRVPALHIVFQSSVGAGDAMVAGLAKALEEDIGLEETIDLSVALSAGACMTAGTRPADKAVVQDLMAKVIKEDIS